MNTTDSTTIQIARRKADDKPLFRIHYVDGAARLVDASQMEDDEAAAREWAELAYGDGDPITLRTWSNVETYQHGRWRPAE